MVTMWLTLLFWSISFSSFSVSSHSLSATYLYWYSPGFSLNEILQFFWILSKFSFVWLFHSSQLPQMATSLGRGIFLVSKQKLCSLPLRREAFLSTSLNCSMLSHSGRQQPPSAQSKRAISSLSASFSPPAILNFLISCSTLSQSMQILFCRRQNSLFHPLATSSSSITDSAAFSRSFSQAARFLQHSSARRTHRLQSSSSQDMKLKPLPLSVCVSNSKTVSLSPPVRKAMTGVPPQKNSCWTMPPGSNMEGMREKSLPMLTRGPSLKKRSGLLQKQLGYLKLRNFILSAQYLPQSSLESALPPTRNWMLKLYSQRRDSMASRMRCTPFCFVILPMKANSGMSFFSYSHLKYRCCSSFFDYRWLPGVLVRRMLRRSSLRMPLGKEKGWGYFQRTGARGDSLSRSNLQECETVPQLSQVSRAHLEGLITTLLLRNSTYHSGGSWMSQLRLPSSTFGYSLPSYSGSRLWQMCMNLVPSNTLLYFWHFTYALTKPHTQSLVTMIEGKIFSWQKASRVIRAKNTSCLVTQAAPSPSQGLEKSSGLWNQMQLTPQYLPRWMPNWYSKWAAVTLTLRSYLKPSRSRQFVSFFLLYSQQGVMMYTSSPSRASSFDNSSTITPSPPTELQEPISGVTKAMGPRVLPLSMPLMWVLSVSLRAEWLAMSLKMPNSFSSLCLFMQNSQFLEMTREKERSQGAMSLPQSVFSPFATPYFVFTLSSRCDSSLKNTEEQIQAGGARLSRSFIRRLLHLSACSSLSCPAIDSFQMMVLQGSMRASILELTSSEMRQYSSTNLSGLRTSSTLMTVPECSWFLKSALRWVRLQCMSTASELKLMLTSSISRSSQRTKDSTLLCVPQMCSAAMASSFPSRSAGYSFLSARRCRQCLWISLRSNPNSGPTSLRKLSSRQRTWLGSLRRALTQLTMLPFFTLEYSSCWKKLELAREKDFCLRAEETISRASFLSVSASMQLMLTDLVLQARPISSRPEVMRSPGRKKRRSTTAQVARLKMQVRQGQTGLVVECTRKECLGSDFITSSYHFFRLLMFLGGVCVTSPLLFRLTPTIWLSAFGILNIRGMGPDRITLISRWSWSSSSSPSAITQKSGCFSQMRLQRLIRKGLGYCTEILETQQPVTLLLCTISPSKIWSLEQAGELVSNSLRYISSSLMRCSYGHSKPLSRQIPSTPYSATTASTSSSSRSHASFFRQLSGVVSSQLIDRPLHPQWYTIRPCSSTLRSRSDSQRLLILLELTRVEQSTITFMPARCDFSTSSLNWLLPPSMRQGRARCVRAVGEACGLRQTSRLSSLSRWNTPIRYTALMSSPLHRSTSFSASAKVGVLQMPWSELSESIEISCRFSDRISRGCTMQRPFTDLTVMAERFQILEEPGSVLLLEPMSRILLMGSLPWSERSKSVQSQKPHLVKLPSCICTQMQDSSSETYSTSLGRCQVKTSALQCGLQQGALRQTTTLSRYFLTFSMRQSTSKGSPLTATTALYSELICQSQLSQYTLRYFTASSVHPRHPCSPISSRSIAGLKCVKFRQLTRSCIWKLLFTIAPTCYRYHSSKSVFSYSSASFATCWKMPAQLRSAQDTSWKCRNHRLASKLNLFSRNGPKQTSRCPFEFIASYRQLREIFMAPSSNRQALLLLKISHRSGLAAGSRAGWGARRRKWRRLASRHLLFIMLVWFHLLVLSRASRPDSRPSSSISKRLSTCARMRCRYSAISSYSLLSAALPRRSSLPTSHRYSSPNYSPWTTGSRSRSRRRREKRKEWSTCSGCALSSSSLRETLRIFLACEDLRAWKLLISSPSLKGMAFQDTALSSLPLISAKSIPSLSIC